MDESSDSVSTSEVNDNVVLPVVPENANLKKTECCGDTIIEVKRTFRGIKRFGKDCIQIVKDIDWQEIQKRNFTKEIIKKKLPIIGWLPKYRPRHFIGDMIAGLTVGLTVIPQGLAYAQVANLTPEYGLYTAFLGCFVYFIFGSAKDITFGPTAVMSLLVGVYATSPIKNDPTFALVLNFVTGFIHLGMALFRVGFIVSFVPHPVINSFTTAAGVTIAFSQIKSVLGLKQIPQDFFGQVYWTFNKLPQTQLWDFVMGFSCLIFLFIVRKIKDIKWKDDSELTRPWKVFKYIVWFFCTSRNALVVIISSGIAAILLANNIKAFALTGKIRQGLPSFAFPAFSVTSGNTTFTESQIFAKISTGLVIVPVLALVELVAIGKVFARIEHYTIDANQELLALGIANVLGSFVGAYPVTGSFSRTAVNYQSGVKTTAGGLWTATLVLLALAFLTPMFYYIPTSALSAVIIMAVTDLIDFSLLVRLWRVNKIDIIPWIVTFICSISIGIEYGIMIGVGLSALMILFPLGRPKIEVHEFSQDGRDVVILKPDRGFVYPAVEYFVDKVELKYLMGEISKPVILNLTHLYSVDYTAVEGIESLIHQFKKKERQIVVCHLRPELLEVFRKAKIKNFVYADNLETAKNLIAMTAHADGPDSVAVADESNQHTDTEVTDTEDANGNQKNEMKNFEEIKNNMSNC